MTSLLRFFSWRYARRHPFRVLLSAMAVALGVALFVSVDVSNTSTEIAFRRTIERLNGNVKLQVTRGRMIGVDEGALAKIDALGVKAAPVLQIGTTLPKYKDEGTLLILGLDLARESGFRRWDVSEGGAEINLLVFAFRDAIVVTRSFADRHHLKVGASFPIDTPSGPRTVTVGAIVKDEGAARVFGGNVAVMEIKTAQRLFKRTKFDRIEILEGDAGRIREALGPDYTVEPPPLTNSFLDEALTRLRALMGISAVALLVGIFIIYNSVSISVVERVKEIGTLRAIGTTRAQVFAIVLVEWTLIGIAGSAAGIAIGFGLARALIQMTAQEVNQLMLVVDVGEVAILPRTLVGAMVLGSLTTILAAFFPARQAMSISPIEMLRQGIYQTRRAASYRRLFALGLVSIALSGLCVFGPWRFMNSGLLGAVLAFLGAAFVLPQLTIWLSGLSRPLLRRFYRIEGYLASDNIAKFPQRTALTVIALSGALAMMVSASAIVLSFKVRGARWMEHAFPFDCTVNATDLNSTLYSSATLPDETAEEVQGVEGVAFSYGVRSALQSFGERDIMIFAIEMEKYDRMQRGREVDSIVPPGGLVELTSGRGVVVSENFGGLYGVKKGDSIDLVTLHGPRRFTVVSLYEDYSWPQGSVFIDRDVYRGLWDDSALTYLDVKFKPGAPKGETKHAIARKLGKNYNLFIYDVDDLKKLGDDTMDRTLRFTNIQVTVAVLIGFLGIVNTLLISVMRRLREIGILRAVGMTKGQVARMVVIESVFIAFVAGVLGVGLGLVGAKWPLALHVFQIAGFQMPFTMPWGTAALALGAALVIGLVASWVPARRAAAVNVLEAIGYE